MSDELNAIMSQEELNAISEMTSIAMGAAGSTLGILLGQEVEIAPPTITEYGNLAEMDIPFGDEPKTIVQVQYVKGMAATVLYILKNSNARTLAESMLGNTEASEDGSLTELQLGAVGELMNQMMNSGATGLASLVNEAVDINNPEVIPYSSDALAQCMPQVLSEPFLATQLQLKAAGAPILELLELRISAESKIIVEQLMSQEANMQADAELDAVDSGMASAPAMAGTTAGAASAMGAGVVGGGMPVDPVTVRPVEFGSFDQQPNVFGEENKNLSLVLDVTLNLTVELGKTELSIKDVLELTRGSVIELDRVAGEPVDLMANGKLIAKGEVVVIEDNFGLRITSIVSPADRLRGL